MKRRGGRVLLACFLLFPVCALGDGGFIPATAFEKVRIPDQRALLHFADGTETLVIDTAFKGEGTNFAWIIPVPSVPVVEPATKGLFSTLQIVFQPKIVHEVFGFYWLAVFLGMIFAYLIWKLRRGESPIGMLVLVLFAALLSAMLLPALGTAPASASIDRVNVIERKQVGLYQTATLKSTDGQAVFEWLRQNNFALPTNFIPAISAYAKEGWCFVASKLHLEVPMKEIANAHPLTLKFKTERAVYPLRLTGINNEPCHIELYVFGPSRAELANFAVERCTTPSFPNATAPSRWRLDGLRIRHPLLRSLVAGSASATKLVGTFTSQQMQADAYVSWAPMREKLLTRYSDRGATVVALNSAVPVLMIGLLGLLWGFWAAETKRSWAKRACKVSGLVCLVAVIGWGTIYLWLPKARVIVSRLPGIRMRQLHDYVSAELSKRGDDFRRNKSATTLPDSQWVRQQLAETAEFRGALPAYCQTNLFTGEPWREEDSPGNFTLREKSGGIDYVWYDLEGGENVVPLFVEPQGR